MPCYDERSSPGYIYKENREKIDKLTRMLCTVLSSLPSTQVKSLNKEINDWWAKHQEWDRRRLATEAEARRKEELKRRAKAKLTEQERKALGI